MLGPLAGSTGRLRVSALRTDRPERAFPLLSLKRLLQASEEKKLCRKERELQLGIDASAVYARVACTSRRRATRLLFTVNHEGIRSSDDTRSSRAVHLEAVSKESQIT